MEVRTKIDGVPISFPSPWTDRKISESIIELHFNRKRGKMEWIMKRIVGIATGILLALSLLRARADMDMLEAARLAYNEAKYEEALQMAESHLEALSELEKKEKAEVYLLKGHILVKLKKWDTAVESLEKAVELDEKLLPAQLELGFLYEKGEEWKKAQSAWKKVLSLADEKDETTKGLARKHLEQISEQIE